MLCNIHTFSRNNDNSSFFFFATLIVVTEHEYYRTAIVKIGVTTVSFHAINPDFRLSTAYVKIYSAIFKLQKL